MSVIATEPSAALDDALMLDRAQSATARALSTDRFEVSNSWLEQREALIAYLRFEYEFASDSVAAYLRPNSDLAWLLLSARPALEAAFGVPVTVVLSEVIDPDAPQRQEQLFAYIRSQLSTADALVALDRFDETWLLERLDRIGGRLGFDLRF